MDKKEKEPREGGGSKPDGENNNQIIIKVRDKSGAEQEYKIRSTTTLNALMDTYCRQKRLPRGSFRFVFNGRRLNRNDTPDSSGIPDAGVIEAEMFQSMVPRYWAS
eukprot:GFKZ01003468.1.p1 GENE.GFKZ01003468.1~~GFKZ01003468.1.p1  ORF type:complete len:106 (+),score=18.64 GFKZ01003468.1:152-469(+)